MERVSFERIDSLFAPMTRSAFCFRVQYRQVIASLLRLRLIALPTMAFRKLWSDAASSSNKLRARVRQRQPAQVRRRRSTVSIMRKRPVGRLAFRSAGDNSDAHSESVYESDAISENYSDASFSVAHDPDE